MSAKSEHFPKESTTKSKRFLTSPKQSQVPNGWPGVAFTPYPPPRFSPDNIRNVIVGNRAVTPEPEAGGELPLPGSIIEREIRGKDREKNARAPA